MKTTIIRFMKGFIRLFDGNLNVQTTLLNSVGNDLSPEMKTFYDMTLLDYAQAALVHDQFGQKRPIPQHGGKTIEFRAFSPLPKALVALTEGVTPDGNSLDVTTITATVAQYGDYIVQSDVLELTALDNTILEATKLLGRQAGLTLDTVTREVLNSGTSVYFCPKTTTTARDTAVVYRKDLAVTSVLTVDDINKAVAILRGRNVPTINGDYVGIIHPFAAYQLMKDEAWLKPHQYQDTGAIYEGEIGKIGGVRFVQTSEAKIFKLIDSTVANNSCPLIDGTGSTSDLSNRYAVFSTLILGEGAYGTTEVTGGGLQTIVKQKGSSGTADPLDQRSSVGWKAIKTAEILIPEYMIRVESIVPGFSETAAAN
jgi:N4-gp56 family major capsid protein